MTDGLVRYYHVELDDVSLDERWVGLHRDAQPLAFPRVKVAEHPDEPRTVVLQWPTATKNIGVANAIGIYDAEHGGKLLATIAFGMVQHIGVGDTPSVRMELGNGASARLLYPMSMDNFAASMPLAQVHHQQQLGMLERLAVQQALDEVQKMTGTKLPPVHYPCRSVTKPINAPRVVHPQVREVTVDEARAAIGLPPLPDGQGSGIVQPPSRPKK